MRASKKRPPFLKKFKINSYLPEEEVLVNKPLALFLIHEFERVELAFEVTREGFAGLHDNVHNLSSLLVRDTRPKREVCKVTANSDASATNHNIFVNRECVSLKVKRGQL